MLTRCPACATHFRVTAEQLKARSGRVRCGECQHVFNALDTLIEEPMVVLVPAPLETPLPTIAAPRPDAEPRATEAAATQAVEVDAPPTPAAEPVPETPSQTLQLPPFAQPDVEYPPVPESFPKAEPSNHEPATDTAEKHEASARDTSGLRTAEADPGAAESSALDTVASYAIGSTQGTTEAAAYEPDTSETAAPEAVASAQVVPAAADETASGTENWSESFTVPPPPRRWPWAIGSLIALAVICLQLLLAFRVEISVLWPQAKPALVALCEIADCEVGLPTKVGMVGIEASDLHPDSENKGRLALSATLKNRAPFAQQFPHLEVTLTDTADQPVARKVLAPADYLSPKSAVANGMPSNADIVVAIGIDSGTLTASGYRLYLFYP